MRLPRRKFLHLAAGLAALPVFSDIARGQTDIEVQQVVRVGYAPFGSPLASLPGATPENFATLDPNSAQGALVELYKAIAKDVGFQVRFLTFVGGKLAEALSSGQVDILSMPVSAENRTVMELSEPILADSEVLIASKADTKPYKTYADMKGQIVGSRTGTIYEDDLRKNGFAVKSYVTAPELYTAVNSSEVKIAINTRFVATAYALLQGQYPNIQIVKSYQPKFSDMTGIGARKDRGALIRAINASLVKLKADGTVKAIFTRYGIADALAQ